MYVIQCKFEEAIRFIKQCILTLSRDRSDSAANSTIEKLLMLSNILFSLSSVRAEVTIMKENITQLLNHYTLG